MTIDVPYRDLPEVLAELERRGRKVLALEVRRRSATYRIHLAPVQLRQVELLEPVLQGPGGHPVGSLLNAKPGW